LITIEEEAELANTQAKLKEQEEELLKGFGLMKAEHLFTGCKGHQSADLLKAFIEEHPDIIFDFIIVNESNQDGEHWERLRSGWRKSSRQPGKRTSHENLP
jgi:hypothetical protein